MTKLVASLCLGLLPVAMIAAEPAPSDERPLSELKLEMFVNLVEGFEKVSRAPERAPYFSYTGSNAESAYVRSKFHEPQQMEWFTAIVPASRKGQRVTFVIAACPGGEGATIVGVPFLVNVNGKPVVTIHSSVNGSTLWQSGEVRALYVHLRLDGYGDPFGLFLLSLPADTVEAGKPATIQVVPKPVEGYDGSFFMIQSVPDNIEFIEKSGGLAKLLKTEVALPGPEPGQAQSDPEQKPLVAMAGLRDDSLCLTGNATARNQRVDGRYTYFDGRTDFFYFPHFSPFHPPGRATNLDEYPNHAGGWVTFAEGKLTDGESRTRIGYPIYLQTSTGIDIVFDLGAEYHIDQVEAQASDNYARNIEIILKSDGEPRWTTVQAYSDRATHIRGSFPKLRKPLVLPVGGMNARWVRVHGVWEATYCGFSEVRIWGRSAGKEQIAKKPLLQLGGEMTIAKPAEIPIALPDPPLLPLPQEMKTQKGEFALTSGMSICISPAASERTKRTAEILAADLKDETGLDLKVVTDPNGNIVFHPLDTRHSTLRPQAYSLSITPDRVEIRGDYEQGVFYATQTLMGLLRTDAKGDHNLPACTIHDWPDKTIRLVSGVQQINASFIKTLARFRVTHYTFVNLDQIEPAAKLSEMAHDRFLQLVPMVQFNLAWGPNPREWTERKPGEKYEDLNPGRINPCPSHPEMWKSYFAQIDKAAACPGDYINVNMDEMYIPEAGSRWNVCERCRARNLSGHELMADTVEKILVCFKGKGKKVLIIDSPFYIPGLSHPDDKENDWRKAADILSQKGYAKDVLIFVWHGEELAKRFDKLGFPVILWGGNRREPIPDVFQGYYQNLSDAAFRPTEILSMMPSLWSPNRARNGSEEVDALVEHFMPVFSKLWLGENLPSRRAGAEFFTIDLRHQVNRTFMDETAGDGKGWADLGPNYDLRALKPGQRHFAGVPFDVLDSAVMVHNRWGYNCELPERVEIPVGRTAASLNFLHTLDANIGVAYWTVKEFCGYYFVVYDDGTYEPIGLKNGLNITKFDGLPDNWDYAPRSKGMARARLVWRGQTGSGNEANLYRTEWVNPFPKKKIDRIIVASPKQGVTANPILIAATGVVPTAADEAHPPKPRYEFGSRRVEALNSIPLIGEKVDLTNGKEEEDGRIWRTADGIVLELPAKPRLEKSLDSTQPPWCTVGNALYETGQDCGMAGHMEASMKIVLPQSRKLTGIRLSGPYRGIIGQAVDRFPPIYNYTVSVSDDGRSFHTVKRDIHIPDEEGPLWLPLDGRSVRHIRIEQLRGKPGVAANSLGIDLIELYEEK